MELIKLTQEYLTGIETIDYEHQKLVNYMNEIMKANEMGVHGRLLIEINIDELISYTVFHFRTEEELMQEHNDPNYLVHKDVHDKLKTEVGNFKKRFNNGEDIGTELIDFLKEWLFSHIQGVDRSYIELFQSKGVV